MNSISYIPSRDQLELRLAPSRGKATWESARFRVWWDSQGNISGIDIVHFSEELKEFRRSLRSMKLGGAWKGLEVSDKDIREARKELLKALEGNW